MNLLGTIIIDSEIIGVSGVYENRNETDNSYIFFEVYTKTNVITIRKEFPISYISSSTPSYISELWNTMFQAQKQVRNYIETKNINEIKEGTNGKYN